MLLQLNESLNSARQIILNTSSKIHEKRFANHEKKLRFLQASDSFLGVYPRHIIEAIGITFLAIFCCYYFAEFDDSANALPFVAALAFAPQKIIPSVQIVYKSWAFIKSKSKAISLLLMLLHQEPLLANNDSIPEHMIENLSSNQLNSKMYHFLMMARSRFLIM